MLSLYVASQVGLLTIGAPSDLELKVVMGKAVTVTVEGIGNVDGILESFHATSITIRQETGKGSRIPRKSVSRIVIRNWSAIPTNQREIAPDQKLINHGLQGDISLVGAGWKLTIGGICLMSTAVIGLGVGFLYQ